MTQNSIAAYRASEEHRHNLVYEEQQNQTIQENMRHNRAYEAIVQQGNQLSYQASIYNANMHFKGTQYAADRSYAASKYAADRNYAASIYNIQQNARNVKYSTDINARTQRFNALTAKSANIQTALISSQAQRYGSDLSAKVNRENMRNQARMNFATNSTHIITSAMSGMSSATSSFARLLPMLL